MIQDVMALWFTSYFLPKPASTVTLELKFLCGTSFSKIPLQCSLGPIWKEALVGDIFRWQYSLLGIKAWLKDSSSLFRKCHDAFYRESHFKGTIWGLNYI